MISLSILLVPFGLFIAGVLAYGFLTMWALYRFGGTFTAFVATFIFWAGNAIILAMMWLTLAGVNWSQPLLNLTSFTSSGF